MDRRNAVIDIAIVVAAALVAVLLGRAAALGPPVSLRALLVMIVVLAFAGRFALLAVRRRSLGRGIAAAFLAAAAVYLRATAANPETWSGLAFAAILFGILLTRRERRGASTS